MKKADGTTEECVTDENGRFKLRHNEEAIFNFRQGTKYYVKEVGISQNTYDKVVITSNGIKNESDLNVGTGTADSVESELLTVGDNLLVRFENQCSVENFQHIYIKKELDNVQRPGSPDGDLNADGDAEYSMKVTLAGEPYQGFYKVGNSYAEAFDSTETLVAAEGGIITLKENQVAVILGNAYAKNDGVIQRGIPCGTSFKVEEIAKDGTIAYQLPVYTITEGTVEAESVAVKDGWAGTDENAGYASGVIIWNQDPKVTVTNKLYQTIKVAKEWQGADEAFLADVKIYVGIYRADGTPVGADSYLELTSENDFTATTSNLLPGTYVVKELRPVKNGENADFTIEIDGTGHGYKAVEGEEIVQITSEIEETGAVSQGYKVSYGTLEWDETEKTEQNIVITNTRLGTLHIRKIGYLESPLEGAEFILKSSDGTFEQTLTTNQDGMITVTNLLPGIYTLQETKAPKGYALSNTIYNITIPYSASGTDTTIVPTEQSKVGDGANAVYYEITKTVVNVPVYELPSTGGSGTFRYWASGLLMILAAVWFLYKNRYREVLKR